VFTIIENEGFAERAVAVLGAYWIWEDVKEFIDLYLARNPKTAGKLIPGTEVYLISLDITPETAIFYSVDSRRRTVTLLEIYGIS
jgi:hypothetical protein